MTAASPSLAGSEGATILVVDDTPENLVVLGEVLSPHYRVRVATSGPAALKIARAAPQPDLILLDIMMPGMNGFDVLATLRAADATRSIPVIFITAMTDAGDEEHGLLSGAVDYITKPFKPAVVLARVRTQLDLKRARDWLSDRNAALEAEVNRRMEEIHIVQNTAIRALSRLAEVRDPETGAHLERTQRYVRTLAERLARNPRFTEALTPRTIDLIVKSTPLHDIGKVGIPDTILLKPGKLDEREWEIMRTHAVLGATALEAVARDNPRKIDFLETAREIAHWHHEKWDGSGYPDGLSGAAIPLSARLMALADVFDALMSRRVYKEPMPFEAVVEIIVSGSGKHFDPDVVDAFEAEKDTFFVIARERAGP